MVVLILCVLARETKDGIFTVNIINREETKKYMYDVFESNVALFTVFNCKRDICIASSVMVSIHICQIP